MARDGKLKGLFFRVQPSDALQAVAAAKLAWDTGRRKLVVVNLNNDWGNNLSKQFIATYLALGGEITQQVTYNAEQPSYRSEVNKALKGNPDGAYVAASPTDGAKILRDWVALGGPDKFVFPLGMNDAKVIEQVGEQYLKNAWYLTPGAPQPNSRAIFYETYEKRYGLEPGKGPGPGRDSGFDAASMIALAMVAAGSYSDGKAIAAGIARVTDPAGMPVPATVEGFSEAIEHLSAGKTCAMSARRARCSTTRSAMSPHPLSAGRSRTAPSSRKKTLPPTKWPRSRPRPAPDGAERAGRENTAPQRPGRARAWPSEIAPSQE